MWALPRLPSLTPPRFRIRTAQVAGVTGIVGLAVIVLSGLLIVLLAKSGLNESQARGAMLANAIFHRAREIVAETANPYEALQADPGLRALLQSSIYGKAVTDASIVNPSGIIVADSDSTRIGEKLDPRPDLKALIEAGSLEQLRVIYRAEASTRVVRLPMELDKQLFGTIVIGTSTLLLREELVDAVQPALLTAGAALVVSLLLSFGLAQWVLYPIHVLRSGLNRLGKGEFGVTLDLPPGDEFGELGAFFNTVSQQLSVDRSGGDRSHSVQREALADGVALFNGGGQLLFANDAMAPQFPVTAVGRLLADILPGSHPFRRVVEETLADRRTRGPQSLDVPAASPDAPDDSAGERRLVLTHAIQGSSGDLVGVLLVSRNLAYLSRMQATLAYSNKLVALGRLTAGIAHEVKNPLNAMMIHLELLRMKIRSGTPALQPAMVGAGTPPEGRPMGGLDPSALEHVAVIEGEVRRLDEVVQGFLKFTRPEEIRLQPVSPMAIVDGVIPLLGPEADRHRVKVEVVSDGFVPHINADAAMLRQALLNLSINACQAMPDGGTLRITCARATQGRVEIRVADTGAGISPEHLGRIFDLYFTTKDHGTGIGLSMVFRIVQMHDGDIDVESTPGVGTTFRVLLPRAQDVGR